MTRRALLVTLLIALLTVGLSASTVRPFRVVLQTSLAPLAAPLTHGATALGAISATVRQIGALQRSSAALRDENQRLGAQVAQLSALRSENEALRSALNFQTEHQEQSLISAHISGRSPDSFQERLLIDRGAADAVAIGAPVIANGFLVGVVTDRTTHQATVQLITASDSVVAVVFVSSRAQGLLRGGLNGLVAGDVSLDATVAPGEALVTSNLGGVVPANIPVGTARTARSLPGDILQEIAVDSPISLATLELVFIGQPVVRS